MAGPPEGFLPLTVAGPAGMARAVLQRAASAKRDWWVGDQTCCVVGRWRWRYLSKLHCVAITGCQERARDGLMNTGVVRRRA